MAHGSSSPKKGTVRSRMATRLVTRKLSSINNTSSVKNTSDKASTRLLRKTANVSKTQSDKLIRVKKASKPASAKKKSVVKTDEEQSDDKKELSPKKTKTRSTKATSKSKDEPTKKKRIGAVADKSVTRQMSLKESFLNQTKLKRLRPRRVAKNYRNDTVSIEKSTSDCNTPQKAKVPIYKSIPLDDSANSSSEVYEFKFDKDDSMERIRRKKRRPAKQNIVQKLMKARAKLKLKENVAKTTVPPAAELKKEEDKKEPPNNLKQDITPKENAPLNVVQDLSPDDQQLDVQKEREANKGNVQVPVSQSSNIAKRSTPTKPVIVAVEKLKNNRVTIKENVSSPTNKEGFRPFRPTNIFNRLDLKHKSTMNNTQLEMSLSPILKTARIFDSGSPWRAPPLYTFSQVKNMYQSTPQNNKLDTLASKSQRTAIESKNYIKNVISTQKANDTKDLENTQIINNQKKRSVGTIRRFGTEITNFGQSTPVDDQSVDIAGKTVAQQETPILIPEPVNPNSCVQDVPEDIDKENNILNYQTPKKTIKRKVKKIRSRSPLQSKETRENIFDKENSSSEKLGSSDGRLENINKENVELTPRPSSLQSSKSPAEMVNSLEQNRSYDPQNASIDKVNVESIPGPLDLQNAKSSGTIYKNTFENEALEPVPGPSGFGKSRSYDEQHNDVDKENIEPIPGPSGLQRIKSSGEKRDNRFDKEDFEPVPGPSGLQRTRYSGEQRILRQSNLNNFLNLADMPESTTIKTPHGIFSDMNSPPINSKLPKKPKESKVEISTAFGFLEDETDENFSELEQHEKKQSNNQQKLEKDNARSAAPARLSIREMKNYLLTNHDKNYTSREKQQDVKRRNVKTKGNKSPLETKTKIKQDILNFSDTFDVLSDASELPQDVSEIPLFADTEPSHFTQPPRRSYKRKRAVRFSFSEGSESETEEHYEVKPKRRKAAKLSKAEERRLAEWVKDVNKTFEEIDDYDLVVE